MFIKIEAPKKTVPQLAFKRDRKSNIIKKTEVDTYNDAKSLLDEMNECLHKYQNILEQQVSKITAEQEQEINESLEVAYQEQLKTWEEKYEAWFDEANEKLKILLEEQENNINELKSSLKKSVVFSIQSRIEKHYNNEKLINVLMEILHKEINDVTNSLQVEHVNDEDGSLVLTIQNEDSIVSINTNTLLEELKESLDHLCLTP